MATFTHNGTEEPDLPDRAITGFARVSDSSGAKDLAGNADVGDDSEVFEIDTRKPRATVTVDHTTVALGFPDPNADPIYEDSLVLIVTVDYDEPMDVGRTWPTITLEDVGPGGTWGAQVPQNTAGWQDDDTFVATFTHNGTEEPDLPDLAITAFARVSDSSGAKDLAGNADVGDDSPVFDIDTRKPRATVTTDHTTIGDAYANPAEDPIYENSLVLAVTVRYDEPMDTRTAPTITLEGETVARWTGPTGGTWGTTDDTYTATFIHDGVDDEVAGVTAEVLDGSGATDEAGNAEVGDVSPPFDVDTRKPTISRIEAEDAACYVLGSLAPPGEFDISIQFSESVWQETGDELVLTLDLDSADWPGAPTSSDGNTLTFGGIAADDTSAAAVWQTQIEVRTNIVEDGDNSCDLAVTGISMTGRLYDVAGNTFVIPAPLGAEHTIHENQNVRVDTTKPSINDLQFNTDATYTARATAYDVDNCCKVTVYFSANVTDNCGVRPEHLDVSVTLPTDNAILETIEWTPTQDPVLGQKKVNLVGSAVVRCLRDCPGRVEVHVEARDGCGNNAVPQTTTSAEGLIWDPIDPIPRDDPRQDVVMDESAVVENSLIEVRRDEFGRYRLILRQDTPARIDVMANDADNCSCEDCAHPFEPCNGCDECPECCATMVVHEIVDPPSYGTVSIEIAEGDCVGGTVIRFAPGRGHIGPDQFTYRTRDACGNVSDVIATVYVQTIPKVSVEDVFVTACSGEPTEFTARASDLWIDPEDPTETPFQYTVVGGPDHGVLSGDPSKLTYTPASTVDVNGNTVPTLDFTETAEITLVYTSAVHHVGGDAVTIQFEDPFGNISTAAVDIRVRACTVGDPAVPAVELTRGEILPVIVPQGLDSPLQSTWGMVLLISLDDGRDYTGSLSAFFSEALNRAVIALDTGPLPPGRYLLSIPLGAEETVELTIEVGDSE